MTSRAPRPKVLAATAGSGVGVTIAAAIVGLLDDHVYRASDVPPYVTGLVMVLVPLALTFAAGYWQTDSAGPTGGEHRRDEAGEVTPAAVWTVALGVTGAWVVFLVWVVFWVMSRGECG